jgi:hypothetical protein
MSRFNAVFAALVLAAMATLSPAASAVITSKGQVVISGSSAAWQSMALAAYNGGACPSASFVVHPPCLHYTGGSNFNLNDTRPTLHGLGGTVNVDGGGVWIVWDSPVSGTRNVWVFLKVDSIVGDRCFFANPKCNITSPSTFPAAGNKISSALWGADSTPPADVQTLFTKATGPLVNTAATDIRPEDALFESCRVNSALGNGVTGFGDGLDGLGYNPNNASGTCVQFNTSNTLAQLVGSPIKSGISGSSNQANVLAFSIGGGKDPFTDLAVASGTTLDIGADAIVFVVSKTNGLAGATAATDSALQNMFSGTNCNGTEIGGTGNTNVYLREPLSGTMTTTEMSVFRRPDKTLPPQTILGLSQETGVGAATLSNTPCTTGGARTRGIGTGEVVSGVKASGGSNPDGLAYTFFSFGNVSSITGASYGYLTLDGADPIAMANNPTQQLPICNAPCSEADFPGWTTGTVPNLTGNSLPQLRAGNYTAWSLLHLITSSATNVKDLLNTSYQYVVSSTPDYIPAVAQSVVDHNGNTISDPGVAIFHSHYQQRDGNDAVLGPAPSNGTFNTNNPPNPLGTDKGGDAGGCTITTTQAKVVTFDKNFIQTGPAISDCAKDRD